MRTISFFLFIILISCSPNSRENISQKIEYLYDEDNYVIWSESQEVGWDLHEGKPKRGQYHFSYIGIFCVYEKEPEFKFEVAAFFHKKKSFVQPIKKWELKENYDLVPIYNKIKFDFYEYGARKLRKYLLHEGIKLSDEDIRSLAKVYYYKTTSEWEKEIDPSIFTFNEENLNRLRQITNDKLGTYSDYSDKVNNYY